MKLEKGDIVYRNDQYYFSIMEVKSFKAENRIFFEVINRIRRIDNLSEYKNEGKTLEKFVVNQFYKNFKKSKLVKVLYG